MHLFLNLILPVLVVAVIDGTAITLAIRAIRKRRRERDMAIGDLSTITTGRRVEVSPFTGTVVEVDAFGGTIKVRDPNGNVHYLDISQLTKALPYVDGVMYLDSYNDVYTWVAASRDWRNRAGSQRAFDYPVRPLRQYALSETQLSD